MRRGAAARPKASPSAGEQPLLAGVFGELAAQRLARVGERMLDQFALLAALRHDDLDACVAGARRERLREQRAVLDLVREQDAARRRLVVVELGEEGVEHLRLGQRSVGAREVGAVAPVLAGAEEEHLDAESARRPGAMAKTSASSTLRGLMPCAPWMARERRDAVAAAARRARTPVARRPPSISLRELLAHALALAGEKSRASAHQLGVVLQRDLARAGAGAALDLVEQAGPRAAVEDAVASRSAAGRRAAAR